MRTRGLLAVLLVTATGMLVTSPGAIGQVPGQDSVSAIGSVVDQFGNPLPGLSISATSGASGENPTGTVTFGPFTGPVTCLAVSGNTAIIGADILNAPIPQHGVLVRVEDIATPNTGQDTFANLTGLAVPTTCPSSLPSVSFSGPVNPGEVIVDDAQSVPTSKNQCKKGGWQRFGFKNQGDCVAFASRNEPS
jgi:hypothetical protein